jgi:hypothetical protein
MIKKGDIIKDKKTNTKHIVESIDYYDNITLIFTEDSKYIPIENVQKCTKTKLGDFIIGLFTNTDMGVNDSEIVDIFRKNKVIDLKYDEKRRSEILNEIIDKYSKQY